MRTIQRLVLFIFLICISVLSLSYGESKQTPIVFVSALNDYPISYVTESGEPSGLAIDLMKQFSSENGYTVEFKMVPDHQVKSEFELRGDMMYDGAFSAQDAFKLSSTPFYYKNYFIFADRNKIRSKIDHKNFSTFIEHLALTSQAIGSRNGESRNTYATKLFDQSSVKFYNSDHVLLKALEDNILDYAIIPEETGYKIAKELNYSNLDVLNKPIYIETCVFQVKNLQTNLYYDINEFIEKYRDNGALNTITSKWFNVPTLKWYSQLGLYQFNIIVGFVIFLIIIVTIRSHYLEKIIQKKSVELLQTNEYNAALMEKLLTEEQYKNQYFINMSHELRTPISVILNAVQLSEGQLSANETIERFRLSKYNHIIENNGYRLLRVINNIIDVNRFETQQYPIHPDIIDIVFFMHEFKRSILEVIAPLTIDFTIESDELEIFIHADPNELERVFSNLVSNTIRFSKDALSIHVQIKTDKANNHLVIVYRDTSIGISKEQVPLLFKKYSTLESNLNKTEGHGLGLYIVKSIIELHKGQIEVLSDDYNGMCYKITLPQKNEAALSTSYSKSPSIYDRRQFLRMELSEISKQIL